MLQASDGRALCGPDRELPWAARHELVQALCNEHEQWRSMIIWLMPEPFKKSGALGTRHTLQLLHFRFRPTPHPFLSMELVCLCHEFLAELGFGTFLAPAVSVFGT